MGPALCLDCSGNQRVLGGSEKSGLLQKGKHAAEINSNTNIHFISQEWLLHKTTVTN
jgi:hypothetical protein